MHQSANIPLSEEDQEAEAARAYSQALVTLAALQRSREPDEAPSASSSSPSNSGSLLNLSAFQGQGPFGSAARIALKLYNRVWKDPSLFGGPGGRDKRMSEKKGKAVKVVDLLEHAAELGNDEALYKLAHISLVCS